MKSISAFFLVLCVIFLVYSNSITFEYNYMGDIFSSIHEKELALAPTVTGIGIGTFVNNHFSFIIFPPKVLYVIIITLLFIMHIMLGGLLTRTTPLNLNTHFSLLIITFLCITVAIVYFSYEIQLYLQESILFVYIGFLSMFLHVLIFDLKYGQYKLSFKSILKIIFFSIVFGCSLSIELGSYFQGFGGEGIIGVADLNYVSLVYTEFPMQIRLPGYIVFRGINFYFLLSSVLFLCTYKIDDK